MSRCHEPGLSDHKSLTRIGEFRSVRVLGVRVPTASHAGYVRKWCPERIGSEPCAIEAPEDVGGEYGRATIWCLFLALPWRQAPAKCFDRHA